MENKLTTHKPLNPFINKRFKIVTYKGDKVLTSEEVKIESQTELKTVLERIKRFNNTQKELFKYGYSKSTIWVMKLVTE